MSYPRKVQNGCNKKIFLINGDCYKIDVVALDENCTPIDLSDKTVTLEICETDSAGVTSNVSTTALTAPFPTGSDETNGETFFTLETAAFPAITNLTEYGYVVYVTYADGNIKTLERGTIIPIERCRVDA